MNTAHNTSLALLRITLGLLFLWAFFDKIFGLGFSTTKTASWLAGTSPTAGFLQFGTRGPLSDMFHALAGNTAVDWLFMLGLLGIGCALTLGICTRIATYSGTILLLLMYLAVLPPEHHPFIDEHIIYILCLWILYTGHAETTLGFGPWWSTRRFVAHHPWLI